MSELYYSQPLAFRAKLHHLFGDVDQAAALLNFTQRFLNVRGSIVFQTPQILDRLSAQGLALSDDASVTLSRPGRPTSRGNYLKRTLLVIAIACVAGCTRNDQNRAQDKAKQAAEELKLDAKRASRELTKDVKELDRKAEPKLHQAGVELKHDAAKASEKLKEASGKLDRDVNK